MIEQEIAIDKIEVLEDGSIQVRRATYLLDETGTRIGSPERKYSRVAYIRGADLSKEDPAVQRIAKVAWAEPDALEALDKTLADVPQIAMRADVDAVRK